MSARAHVVVPGSIDQRTGGYGYDRRIVAGLRALGREVIVHQLPGSFPRADRTAQAAAHDAAGALAADDVAVIDGLALPGFDGLTSQLAAPFLALVHHPLALETGLAAADAEALRRLERRLLADAARIVVTSPRTRLDLAPFGLDDRRIGVVLPGTDRTPIARGSNGPGLSLLCVATLTARKGHLTLIEALARLRELPWRLVCVGSTERAPEIADAVAARIERLGLSERIELCGEIDDAELTRRYHQTDLAVLASHHEGYGMVLGEALAHGLPIVATTAGAIPGTVPEGAGILVPPGDVACLASVLGRVLTEPGLRARLAAGAAAARDQLPSWADAARAFAAELDRVVP